MEHLFIPAANEAAAPLLLLHGTGGDEHSLVDIGRFISSEAAILSLRGDVLEGTANRFFKRYPDGRLDLESLAEKTDQLLAEVHLLAEKYHLSVEQLVAVGYSNGANIAANSLLQKKNSFQKAILFHAMPADNEPQTFTLRERAVFLTAGLNDPLVLSKDSERLVAELEQRGADVSTVWTAAGHSLTMEELEAARSWYEAHTGTQDKEKK
ncbi:alpha/beta hydrolase [Listeria costaricensis]|uniref:alpha/beta hydrolase n=1 Tax=Listeria costaricensis TaxID=2026604 RepID=UPI000C07F0A0|nr:alpha/beta hydrolase [Listeria costaricensis]